MSIVTKKNKTDEMRKKNSYISWQSVAVMTFCTLWGFNNLINGCFYFGQTRVIGPWLLIFVLYFLPYALMVGELGSIFRKEGGGVSSWIFKTIGRRIGFIAGWIGWVVVLPYLAQKPSLIIVSFNWIINQNADISRLDPMTVQLIGVVIFLVCVLIASRGVSVIKVIASIGGAATFIMALLFVFGGIASPFINVNPSQFTTYPIEWDISKFFPTDLGIFASLSILLFGVGGAEKVAPYVNKMKKPGKDFPKGIIAVVIMVAIVAFIGAMAIGIIFGQDGQEVGSDFITNGQYMCFYKLGNMFGLGNTLLVAYAISYFINNIAVLIISIDVPLRLLLSNSDLKYIPKGSLKQNKKGAYTYWLLVVVVIVVMLLFLPTLIAGNTDNLIKWLLEICSIVMPVFYLCVFAAYAGLKFTKKKIERHDDDFVFVKNKKLGVGIAIWLTVITLIGMVMQIWKDDPLQTLINFSIPFILVMLGFILPLITKWYNKKHGINVV